MNSVFADASVDAVKEYWDRRPCNVRHSPLQIGTRAYFDEVEARKYTVEPHIPIFAEFDRWRDKRVLEIGCGIGTDTIRFARAGAHVTAVDISPESLKLARQRSERYGLSEAISFYNANAEELSSIVPPRPFDLVYSFGVIHHTPHPERVIKQVRLHYAQQGTVLKLMVYNRYSWKVLWTLMSYGRCQFWSLDRLIAKHSEAQSGCPVTYTFSPATLRRLIGSGFQVDEIRVEHIFPYRIADYVQYRYVWNWYFRYLPRPLFRWMERTFGWHLLATATAV